jgi:hypothetical protein
VTEVLVASVHPHSFAETGWAVLVEPFELQQFFFDREIGASGPSRAVGPAELHGSTTQRHVVSEHRVR